MTQTITPVGAGYHLSIWSGQIRIVDLIFTAMPTPQAAAAAISHEYHIDRESYGQDDLDLIHMMLQLWETEQAKETDGRSIWRWSKGIGQEGQAQQHLVILKLNIYPV